MLEVYTFINNTFSSLAIMPRLERVVIFACNKLICLDKTAVVGQS